MRGNAEEEKNGKNTILELHAQLHCSIQALCYHSPGRVKFPGIAKSHDSFQVGQKKQGNFMGTGVYKKLLVFI